MYTMKHELRIGEVDVEIGALKSSSNQSSYGVTIAIWYWALIDYFLCVKLIYNRHFTRPIILDNFTRLSVNGSKYLKSFLYCK